MPGANGHDRISTAMPATELIQSQGAARTFDQVDSADRVLLASGVFVPGWVIGSQDSALICGVADVTVVPGLCTVQAASQQGRVRWPRK